MNFKFLRDNKQVVYSIALMILIPGVIILNTWIFSTSFRKTIDQSLQDKAIGIGESVNAGLSNQLNSPEEMQTFIDNWKGYNSDTKSLDIFYRDNDTFKLVATMNNNEKLGKEDNSLVYTIAWNNNWPSAQKIYESDGTNNHRYWLVVMPLKDLNGQKQALLSMKLSADVIDTIMAIVLGKSYWMLLITIIFIVLLLLVNSRLFEYSILYNKIKEVDAMKDEFISMASHELRTPVTVIRGYATMMIEEAQKLGVNNEAKEYLSIIDVSSERLNNLIEDLLNVSRIEQGRLKMDIKEIEIWPLIEETIKEMKIQADNKGLVLSCVLEPNTKSFIFADKDRLKQVLINIIGNSIKYTPSGSVEVKALNRDSNLVIIIKDTGIGMTAKQREHLFEKFYRIKTKKTEDIVGTGLGLWITKQIIELMKGTITIDSMENVGTQVTLEFPLIK
ncbi:MAG TPA: HAMP domain-containing sensor histidine kinase [Candidatus Pacearchaeota archaeon]|nr:HAMP domain-containing sensor histidine kinase [Candidatus Pacearchaeota archaeon]HPR79940.1 HAMP domain-containing sensor histidine kinase [Candidatus Pacearchaeota archaeon]